MIDTLAYPDNWGRSTFRRVAYVAEGLVDPRVEPWASAYLIAPNHIESHTGRILTLEQAAEQGADSGKYRVRSGDILFSKIRPRLNKVAIATTSGLCSADMYPVRLRRGDRRFAQYWMLARPFHDYVSAISDRVKMPKVNREELADAPWVEPPLEEQRTIAAFLDRETAKIDLLIEKQTALIDLLRERRRATVWILALGQEKQPLTPGAWWGSPPVHWDIDKLGRHARVVNGSTPNRSTSEFWRNGTLPWLNSSYANHDIVTTANQYVTEIALDKCHLPWLRPGAVLVGITGQGRTRGMAALLEMETTINQHLAAVVADRRLWHPRYLTHLLRAAYGELRFISDEAGSTKGALTCAALHAFRVPRPPLAEQRSIADMIDAETARIDTLIAKAEGFIELTKERRSALITAAVTGRIDVTAAVAA